MKIEKAHNLAIQEMHKHGLIEAGWVFKFDKGRRRFGSTQIKRNRVTGEVYFKVITLSRKLTEINEESRVLNTIRHEIAHALVGFKEGHGSTWKLKAVEVGAVPKACFAEVDTNVSYKWHAQCKDCSRLFKLHRRSSSRVYSHSSCRNNENRGELIWKQAV